MDIKCTRYPHLWGKKLLVEGREIAFDDAGISWSVDPVVGQILLQNGGYVDVTVQVPAAAAVIKASAPTPQASGRRNKQAVAGS